jgi:RimJ/RimL family protein N-acetyltransferase
VTLPAITPRLVLRELTASDLDGLAALWGDPRVRWWETGPWTREQAGAELERILARYRDDGIGECAVVLRATHELIGICGPSWTEVEGIRLLELGWQLRSDQWGHGYATEAARAAIAHAASLGISRLHSLITPDNVRSQRVAGRLGMTVERQVTWHGSVHDVWALDLR